MKPTFIALPPNRTDKTRLHFMRADEIRTLEVIDGFEKNPNGPAPFVRIGLVRGGCEDYPFHDLASATDYAEDLIAQLNA